MKIGIISDSHGSATAWELVAGKYFRDCSLIIHAGDILYHGPRNPLPDGYNPQKLAELINGSGFPIVFARGNCDADIDSVLVNFPVLSPYAFVFIEGKSVLITHGTDMDSEKMDELAKKYRTDLFISGHTHEPFLEKKGNTVFLNPGSCAIPKSEYGPTVALWEKGRIYIFALKDGNKIMEIDF